MQNADFPLSRKIIIDCFSSLRYDGSVGRPEWRPLFCAKTRLPQTEQARVLCILTVQTDS